MGIWGVKELTVGIMISGANMEHPSGMVFMTSGKLTVLLSV